MNVILLTILLLGYSDPTLGYSINPPEGYKIGYYEGSPGATWENKATKSELRMIVLPIQDVKDPKSTLDTLAQQMAPDHIGMAYLSEEELTNASALAGLWMDMQAGAGEHRIHGRIYMLISRTRILIGFALSPLARWESLEPELMKSLTSIKVLDTDK